jgi:magnesium transporter
MLVSCAAYQDGKKLGDIALDRIAEYLKLPHTFVWVALHDPDAAELAQMQAAFELHPLAIEDAQLGHQRPKIEEYGDSLFAVLHIVEPGEKELLIGEVAIFAGANHVLSVRSRAKRASRKCARAASASRSCCALARATSYTPSWMP